MEPTPPKGRKPRSQRPFYDAGKKTSAEIIAEARSNVRTLETNRPFTPLDASRRLFGPTSVRSSVGRPPSSLSMGRSISDSFSQPSSRPPSGRLTPIESVASVGQEKLISNIAEGAKKGNEVLKGSNEDLNREHCSNSSTHSQDFSQACPPPSGEPDISRSRRVRSGNSHSFLKCSSMERRAHSGPKERTQSSMENGNGFSLKKHSSVGDMRDDIEQSSQKITEDNAKSADKSVLFIKDIITPLLKQMELNHLHGDLLALAENFDVLWKTLKRANLFQKPSSSALARGRAQVLRTIFKLADVQDPKILVKLSKLCLLMNVTGKQQNSVCKILFVVSKDHTQDVLFKQEDLVGDLLCVIGHAEISSELDWLIYAVGTIKFLSGNSSLHEELATKNALGCLTQLMNTIEIFLSEQHPVHDQIPHLLVQISAVIRNLVDISTIRKQVVSSGAIEILLKLLKRFSKDSDYVLNISRIFSKLTLYSDCCNAITSIGNGCKDLFELFVAYRNAQAIVVRLLFTFGNIAAKVEDVQLSLFIENESLKIISSVGMEYLLRLPQTINSKKSDSSGSSINEEEMREKNEDVLIKATRFIANLSVHPLLGPQIADSQSLIDMLISVSESDACRQNEELLINTAATFNNISFYAKEGSHFDSKQGALCEALLRSSPQSSLECTIEITRVFGNLSRSKEVRRILIQRKFVEVLVTLLDSSDREVIFCVCGTLINMMLEKEARLVLLSHKGVTKLVDALKDFGQTDWQLAGMIGQCLWNFSESLTSSSSCFGENEVEELLDLLHLYLDKDFALDFSENENLDESTKDVMTEIWKDHFVPVGSRLLQRISAHHTDLVPLEA